jgi:hypothetical protein
MFGGLQCIKILAIMILVLSSFIRQMWCMGPVPHSPPQTVEGPPEYQAGYVDGCKKGLLANIWPSHYKAYYVSTKILIALDTIL